MIGTCEKKLQKTKNKKRWLENLTEAKLSYFLNEYTIFSLTESLRKPIKEITAFNIVDRIEYMINLYNLQAYKKNISFVLCLDACFPKEVNGNCAYFDLFLSSCFNYIVKGLANCEVKITSHTKSFIENGYLLSFNFEFLESEEIKEFYGLSLVKHLDDTKHMLVQALKIIKAMGGNTVIDEAGEKMISGVTDLPFTVKATDMKLEPCADIRIFKTEKINEFSKRWTYDLKEAVQKKPVEKIKEALIDAKKKAAKLSKFQKDLEKLTVENSGSPIECDADEILQVDSKKESGSKTSMQENNPMEGIRSEQIKDRTAKTQGNTKPESEETKMNNKAKDEVKEPKTLVETPIELFMLRPQKSSGDYEVSSQNQRIVKEDSYRDSENE